MIAVERTSRDHGQRDIEEGGGAMDFPLDHESLSTQWLTRVLREAGVIQSATVQTFEVSHANLNTFVGEAVRITLDYDDVEPDAPLSLYAKFPARDVDRRAYFAALGMYRREINFYRHFAARVGVRTPVCYSSALDEATGLGVLLIEDLAPAVFGSREAGCTYDEAQSILETIAGVHANWHGSPELRAIDWLETYSSRLLSERFRGAWRALCSRYDFPEAIIAIGDEISVRPSLLDSLGEPPLTLIHRDYQLDNIPYLSDENRYAVIDWQLVMRGRGVFDVANFLCWNLPGDNRKSWERSLLQHYFSALIAFGVHDYTFEACERDYRLSILECFARVVSIAGSDVVNNQPLWKRLETLLQRTVAAMMDLDLVQFVMTGDGFQDA